MSSIAACEVFDPSGAGSRSPTSTAVRISTAVSRGNPPGPVHIVERRIGRP
jgi:hypothetical protein